MSTYVITGEHRHAKEVRHIGADAEACRLGWLHDGCCPDTPGCDMPGVTMSADAMVAALTKAGYRVVEPDRAAERAIHERHVDLWAHCRLCRIEAGSQPDRLRRDE